MLYLTIKVLARLTDRRFPLSNLGNCKSRGPKAALLTSIGDCAVLGGVKGHSEIAELIKSHGAS